MSEYLVKWEMSFEATSPEGAARQARQILLDPDNIASVFTVNNKEIDTLEGEDNEN